MLRSDLVVLAGGTALEGSLQWLQGHNSASGKRELEAQCQCSQHQALQHLLKQRLYFLLMWDLASGEAVSTEGAREIEQEDTERQIPKGSRDYAPVTLVRRQWIYTLFPDPIPRPLLYSEGERLDHPQGHQLKASHEWAQISAWHLSFLASSCSSLCGSWSPFGLLLWDSDIPICPVLASCRLPPAFRSMHVSPTKQMSHVHKLVLSKDHINASQFLQTPLLLPIAAPPKAFQPGILLSFGWKQNMTRWWCFS